MDAKELRELLDVMVESGVSRAKVPVRADWPALEVEFAPARRSVGVTAGTTTFTGADGSPVDLSEGAPETADESVDSQIAATNFQRGKQPGS